MIPRISVLFVCACQLVWLANANAAELHIVRGFVTADDTPLGNASVVLRSDETQQAEYGTFTERDGTFVLRDVANGRYRLIVEKEGYVSWLGQQRPNGPGLILAITDTSSVRDVRVRLGYGLAPGKYYVGVSYTRNLVGPSKVVRVDQSNRADEYVPTFFPGVLDPLAASDDEFLAKYKGASKPIHLEERSAVSINVTVLP